MSTVEVFERWAQEYDAWFATHIAAYHSELAAVKVFLDGREPSLEIGVGSGRFAGPLGVTFGVEPAWSLAKLAQARGVKVVQGRAEFLPFAEATCKLVLLITVLEFVPDPEQAVQEALRVLQPGGRLVVALLDPASPLGRCYEARKDQSKFYAQARFLPVLQVLEWLAARACRPLQVVQTIFREPAQLIGPEPVRPGHGEGLFVVIAADKPERRPA